MYLKALRLKGFKSFADKTVLGFEPGISAVVGPNGSGKSNISDAILWVLGERNAKALRGQAMEDVIFAGSSARNASGLAEVELVLDNTDGTIPVDFQEISLARRMYRTGESEYLINGAVARRMDLLDILHDSGLGAGGHSIISQGSLDSILQSKPEDRRVLVEQAAGVLKHKQRKLKSQKKIEQMDAHVVRARDIVKEVERQLKPLERKAKKAEQYAVLTEEFNTLRLSIAVDDLHMLQQAWEDAKKRETACIDELETTRKDLIQAEAYIEEIQAHIQKESSIASDLSDKYRSAQRSLEKFDATSLLLHEKKRSFNERMADMALSERDIEGRKAKLKEERKLAEEQHTLVATQLEKARSEAETFAQLCREKQEALRTLKNDLHTARSQRRKLDIERETLEKRLFQLTEQLHSEEAHQKLVGEHHKTVLDQLGEIEASYTQACEERAALAETLEAIVARDSRLSQDLAQALRECEDARTMHKDAQASLSEVEAEITALKDLEKAYIKDNVALSWFAEHREAYAEVWDITAHIKAPHELMNVIEALLGANLNALQLASSKDALELASELAKHADTGFMSMVIPPVGGTGRDQSSSYPDAAPGEPLLSLITYDAAVATGVQALLGSVIVCASPEEALAAHDLHPEGWLYITQRGFCVHPQGVVHVRLGEISSTGRLERFERLEALEAEKLVRSQSLEAAHTHQQQREAHQRDLQRASLELSQERASLQGKLSAQEQTCNAIGTRLTASKSELESSERKLAEIEAYLKKEKPGLSELQERIAALADSLDSYQREITDKQALFDPLQHEVNDLEKRASEARFELTRLEEKEVYSRRLATARVQDAEELEKRQERLDQQKQLIHIRQAQIDPLLASFEALSACAQKSIEQLELKSSRAKEASQSNHSRITQARQNAQAHQRKLDALSESISSIRVEKARLDVQVEQAVRTIVEDCATPLDQVSDVSPLANRCELEARMQQIEDRRRRLGTINPDAAEEYVLLKERFDFLSGQLDDLEQARGALQHIVAAIDERMKEDFLKTFNAVNTQFQEIFAILFPGGSARLTLCDIDGVSQAGIEVEAQPKGKKIAKMTLMSGGEKSLTAIALLFAVYSMCNAPFYVLDEVEAALDDTNLRRLVAYLDSLRHDTQLILITHQRRTMEMADALFGVSMQADGITRVISQKLDHALRTIEG